MFESIVLVGHKFCIRIRSGIRTCAHVAGIIGIRIALLVCSWSLNIHYYNSL